MTKTGKASRLYYFAIVMMFVACLVLAGVGLVRIRAKLAGAVPMKIAPVAVKTIFAALGKVERTIPALAMVKSAATVQIKVETGGRLLKMPLREGDLVKAGQVIGIIDSREQDAMLQAARARNESAENQVSATSAGLQALVSQLDAAKTNLEFWAGELRRDDELYKAGAIAQTAFEGTRNRHAEASSRVTALQSQIQSQKAQIDAMQSQKKASEKDVMVWQVRRDYAELTSPVDGIISARFQEEGNRVLPGTAVYNLEDITRTRLIMQVPQESALKIRVGQPVNLQGYRDAGFVISRVFPVQNELRQIVVEAETTQPCEGLVYDMQIPVRIVVEHAEGTVIPEQARFVDFTRPDQFFVYLVKDARAVRTPMQARLNGDSGLVVVDSSLLAPGSEIAVGSYLENIRLPASFAVEVIK